MKLEMAPVGKLDQGLRCRKRVLLEPPRNWKTRPGMGSLGIFVLDIRRHYMSDFEMALVALEVSAKSVEISTS